MLQIPPDYVVAVTGAASGIGAATTAQLRLMGVTVHALDRAFPSGSPTGAGEEDHEVDVTDDRQIRDVVNTITQRHGHIDALVNCVGINPDAGTPSHQVDLDVFDQVYRVNLRAAFALSQAVLPGMVERRFGRIVHVASIAGKEGNPTMASYSASKAGLIGLVKSLGKEYAQTGVTINAIAPAVIRTPLVERTDPAVVATMLSKIPMARAGALSEIAEALVLLASPVFSYTTGFTFDLSGGRATY